MKLKKGTLVLLVCFILFPLISYIYLKKGIDMRANGLKELHFKRVAPEMPDSSLFHIDSLKGRVTIVIVSDSLKQDVVKKLTETIYKQNENNPTVRVIIGESAINDSLGLPHYFYSSGFLHLIKSSDVISYIRDISEIDSLKSAGNKAVSALIIDRSASIRKGYDLNNIEQIRMLIRHAAILAPEREKIEPKLVRQKEK